MSYSKNSRVRTYIFGSLAKLVLVFWGTYWQCMKELQLLITKK